MNFLRVFRVLACLCIVSAAAGCANLEIEPASHARLSSGKYVHMPLISMDEERLLREATERAMTLHSQLRAFDAANKAVENRIQELRSEFKGVSKRYKLRKSDTSVTRDASQVKSIAVRFSKGSVALDDDMIKEIIHAVSHKAPTPQVDVADPKEFIVLQVATNKKSGIDAYNSRRLGSIYDLLNRHNVSSDAVKLKIVRINSKTLPKDLRTDGNASRTIQLSAVKIGKVTL